MPVDTHRRVRYTDGHFDRMGRFQSVGNEKSGECVCDELCPDIEFGIDFVDGQVFDPGGESFVQPCEEDRTREWNQSNDPISSLHKSVHQSIV